MRIAITKNEARTAMKQVKLTATLFIGIGAFASVAATATPITDVSYYVRPALRVGGGELIDGYEANGAKSKDLSQGVTGTSRSAVNLGNGTVKMYVDETLNSPVGFQAFGGFGERIDIRNGAGTTWDFAFGIEGEIFGDLGFVAPGQQPATFVYNVGLVAHQAGVANGQNFLGIANDPCWGQDPLHCTPAPAALVNEFAQGVYVVPADEFPDVQNFYEYVSETVFGSIDLLTNFEQFDIFTYTNIFLAFDTTGPESGLTRYTMDFENTATFTQTVAPGVEVYSSSGEFLGFGEAPPIDTPPTGVPVPATFALFSLGLVGLGWSRRKKA